MQLYGNRALAYQQRNELVKVLSDADYIISNLDKSNEKALRRRSHAYKELSRYEEAANDLQVCMLLYPSSVIQIGLDFCLQKIEEQQEQAAELDETMT